MELNTLSDYESAYPHLRKVTLCYLIDKEGVVLIAMKKRGFGVGKWNGVGGRVVKVNNLKSAIFIWVRDITGAAQVTILKNSKNHAILPRVREDPES